jgi:glycogen(starch) synthase
VSVRVLHLTRDFPPRSAGGISTAVGGMVHASLRAGLDCAVISFDGWRPQARAQATAPAVPAREAAGAHEVAVLRVSAPAQLDAARAFAVEHGPGIVHVHHDMLWPFAAELRALLGARAVLTVHVLQAEQNRLRGLRGETLSSAAQARALAEADRVIAPSHAVADRLRARAAWGERLVVVPLGVAADAQATRAVPGAAPLGADAQATRAVPGAAPLGADARSTRGVPGAAPLVLYAGRFADINGTAELFEAIPRIATRVPGARFVIAGGLPENRKAEARWLRRWRERAPAEVQPRVAFPGWLAADTLHALYAEAALLLVPSWFETFGMVVLEAMLHGVPIAATRAGALPERVEHERTGLLSAPRDVDGLVENALRLLDDRALAARLGAAAAIEARRYHWDAVLPALRDVYAPLLRPAR